LIRGLGTDGLPVGKIFYTMTVGWWLGLLYMLIGLIMLFTIVGIKKFPSPYHVAFIVYALMLT